MPGFEYHKEKFVIESYRPCFPLKLVISKPRKANQVCANDEAINKALTEIQKKDTAQDGK